jgi:hypothetical protein
MELVYNLIDQEEKNMVRPKLKTWSFPPNILQIL